MYTVLPHYNAVCGAIEIDCVIRCKMNGCTGETAGIAWIPDGAFITGYVYIIKIQQIQKKIW